MSHTRSNGIMGSLRGSSGFVNLGRANGQNSTGFSIHDAFEEEDTDEMIKVYGNGSPKTMNGGSGSKQDGDEEGVKIRMERSDSNRYNTIFVLQLDKLHYEH